jgi:5-methylcytosine-specific restriction endonuclease McrA
MSDACSICGRPLAQPIDLHHVIPKTFGGKQLIKLHKICHQKVHSVFSERELMHFNGDLSPILEHEQIRAFITWVRKKDPSFYDVSKDTKARKSKRRR